jgi:hypothetical protein
LAVRAAAVLDEKNDPHLHDIKVLDQSDDKFYKQTSNYTVHKQITQIATALEERKSSETPQR